MNKTDTQAALEVIAAEDADTQARFEADNEAYITRTDTDTSHREFDAARLDTNNAEFRSLATDPRFEYAPPNWNDSTDDMEIYGKCDEIADTLRRLGAEKNRPRDTLMDIERLLNCSFSERIKVHIVQLVADTETIEGACRHCFGLYHEDNKYITGAAMAIWQALERLIGNAPVYHAFLQRAWHLNPTSRQFPRRYRDIATAIAAETHDRHNRPTYADPHKQMEALNETLKKLAYSLRHTTEPTELAKLANAQVRVAGALHVINEKLDRTHENAILDAQRRALNP